MKTTTFGLTALGAVLLGVTAQAQVNASPAQTNAVPSTVTTPTLNPDTLQPASSGRQTTDDNRRNRRRNRATSNSSTTDQNSRMNSSGSTSTYPQDGSTTNPGTAEDRYRQNATTNGTTINSSNTTNHNTSNAVTSPTSGSPADQGGGSQVSNGQNNSAARGSGSTQTTSGSVQSGTTGTPMGNTSDTMNSGTIQSGNASSGTANPSTSSSGMNNGSTTSGATNGAGSMSSGSTGGMNNMSGGATTGNANMNQPGATGTGMAVSGNANERSTASNTARSRSNISVGDFAASSPEYLTLQNAIQSADLTETLRGSGPYTLFAPYNTAFKKLPTRTQNTLLNGNNRQSLKNLLSAHVVEGTLDSEALRKQINEGNGRATLRTLGGSTLTAQIGTNGRIMLTDEQGGVAYVNAPDQYGSNGVVHGVDKVLLPKAVKVPFR